MSFSRDSFYKTPTGLDIDAEKLRVLSALFTIRGGKLLILSNNKKKGS